MVSQWHSPHPSISIPLGLSWDTVKVGWDTTLPVNSCFGFLLNYVQDYIRLALLISSVCWITPRSNSANSCMGLIGWSARRKLEGAKLLSTYYNHTNRPATVVHQCDSWPATIVTLISGTRWPLYPSRTYYRQINLATIHNISIQLHIFPFICIFR